LGYRSGGGISEHKKQNQRQQKAQGRQQQDFNDFLHGDGFFASGDAGRIVI
jgi:hypothetical protein